MRLPAAMPTWRDAARRLMISAITLLFVTLTFADFRHWWCFHFAFDLLAIAARRFRWCAFTARCYARIRAMRAMPREICCYWCDIFFFDADFVDTIDIFIVSFSCWYSCYTAPLLPCFSRCALFSIIFFRAWCRCCHICHISMLSLLTIFAALCFRRWLIDALLRYLRLIDFAFIAACFLRRCFRRFLANTNTSYADFRFHCYTIFCWYFAAGTLLLRFALMLMLIFCWCFSYAAALFSFAIAFFLSITFFSVMMFHYWCTACCWYALFSLLMFSRRLFISFLFKRHLHGFLAIMLYAIDDTALICYILIADFRDIIWFFFAIMLMRAMPYAPCSAIYLMLYHAFFRWCCWLCWFFLSRHFRHWCHATLLFAAFDIFFAISAVLMMSFLFIFCHYAAAADDISFIAAWCFRFRWMSHYYWCIDADIILFIFWWLMPFDTPCWHWLLFSFSLLMLSLLSFSFFSFIIAMLISLMILMLPFHWFSHFRFRHVFAGFSIFVSFSFRWFSRLLISLSFWLLLFSFAPCWRYSIHYFLRFYITLLRGHLRYWWWFLLSFNISLRFSQAYFRFQILWFLSFRYFLFLFSFDWFRFLIFAASPPLIFAAFAMLPWFRWFLSSLCHALCHNMNNAAMAYADCLCWYCLRFLIIYAFFDAIYDAADAAVSLSIRLFFTFLRAFFMIIFDIAALLDALLIFSLMLMLIDDFRRLLPFSFDFLSSLMGASCLRFLSALLRLIRFRCYDCCWFSRWFSPYAID